jgi:hypothetical protein
MLKPRLSILAAVAALGVVAGGAYASGLPSAAPVRASGVLQRLGITPAAATSHAHVGVAQSRVTSVPALAAPGMAAGQGSDSQAAAPIDRGSTARNDASGAPHPRKGAEVSTLARTTTATGQAKGATISTVASGGKRKAGRHGPGGSSHGSTKPAGPRHRHGGHASTKA